MFSQQRRNVSGQNLLTEVLLLDSDDVCLLATRLSDDPSYFSQHASDTMPNLGTGKVRQILDLNNRLQLSEHQAHWVNKD